MKPDLNSPQPLTVTDVSFSTTVPRGRAIATLILSLLFLIPIILSLIYHSELVDYARYHPAVIIALPFSLYSFVKLLILSVRFSRQKLVINHDRIALTGIFKTTSIEGAELSDIQARLYQGRGRARANVFMDFKIIDMSGKSLIIRIHMYKNESALAASLLDFASHQNLRLDDNTQQTLQELSLSQLVESDRQMIQILKLSVIVLSIFLLVLLLLFIVSKLGGQ